ncbi:hypothetical protein IKF30_00380 [Candidatus Saccharibacteria bacterium]|nr:hypothetical protein [Candidatus Saccharibacteria bacterium]
MDSSQDNNFGNTMPSGGGGGVGAPANDEVSMGIGVGAGGVSVNPVQSSQPVSSMNLAQPMTPVGQTNPVMPANPVQPVALVNPTQSTVSANPMQPIISDNTQPAVPMSSAQPAAPVNLAQPTIPVGQAQPAMSVNPMQSTMPMEQANPITSNGFEQQMSPMGMNINMMNPSMPMSSDTGDIILNVDDKKRFKRGWIVGIVLGLMVVAGVVAVIIIKPWELNGSIVNDTVKDKLNIYANYFLFGELSNKNIDWQIVDDDGFESFFEKNMNHEPDDSSISRSAMINGLYEYYNDFYEAYINEGFKSSWVVNNYRNNVALLTTYYDVGITTRTELLNEYSKDRSVANDLINSVSEKYTDFDGMYNSDISELVKDWGKNQLQSIEEYDAMGCLSNGQINYGCAAEQQNETIDTLYQNASIILNRINAIANDCKKSLYLDLHVTYDYVLKESSKKGENENEY